MTVYQTYINVLNSDMKAAFEEANPFVFRHISHLAGRRTFHPEFTALGFSE
jgi:hypothetical protein